MRGGGKSSDSVTKRRVLADRGIGPQAGCAFACARFFTGPCSARKASQDRLTPVENRFTQAKRMEKDGLCLA